MERREVSNKFIYFNNILKYRNYLTKTSKDAPDWFNVVPSWKAEQFKKYLENNEDTINIISKHQNWITISPRSMDRKHPLEKMKAENMEVTSKIMPKWMEIKHKKALAEIDDAAKDAYAKTVSTIFGAISPDLTAALTSKANVDMVAALERAVAPYALATDDQSVADVVARITKGLPIEEALDKITKK